MKGIPDIKPLPLSSTFNLYQKRASKDSTNPLSVNSRYPGTKTPLTKKNFPKENITIDLKEGLYGGHRLDDSHFRAILRDSNCSSVKSAKCNSKQIHYYLDPLEKGTHTLTSPFVEKENYTPRKDLQVLRRTPPVKKAEACHIQKVKGYQNRRFIPCVSPNKGIVTCPGEFEVRRHSLAPPSYPYNGVSQHELKIEYDSNDKHLSLQTEPAQGMHIHKFTFLGALTTHDDSYNEEEGGQTSRFPDNNDDMNNINQYELNSVVAQEDSRIDVKLSREKKLLSRMTRTRKSSKSQKKPSLLL